MNTHIWDLAVRVFHWSLAVAFFISYLTGEEESDLHIWAGYTVLGLISFRVLWGLIGTKYARFSNFLYSPSETIKYLKQLLKKEPKRYLGHNPAGGWMIIALLVCLFVVTISGLKVYAIEEGKGPLAGTGVEFSMIGSAHASGYEEGHNESSEKEGHHDGDEKEEEFWEEVHEGASNFAIFLIFLHVLCVIISSKLHKENLVKSMVTGDKKD